MSATAVLGSTINESPNISARLAGALWLTCILTSMFSFFTDSRMIVRGNAADTAAAIVANAPLFRASVTADVLSGLTYLGVTALLYHLLKPGGRSLSFTAAVFGAGGVTVGGGAFLAHIAPVVLLNGDAYLAAFTTTQLQSAALLALKLRSQVFAIGMMFFGVQIFLVGRLIVRSTVLPRALGVVATVAGPTYVLGALT